MICLMDLEAAQSKMEINLLVTTNKTQNQDLAIKLGPTPVILVTGNLIKNMGKVFI